MHAAGWPVVRRVMEGTTWRGAGRGGNSGGWMERGTRGGREGWWRCTFFVVRRMVQGCHLPGKGVGGR